MPRFLDGVDDVITTALGGTNFPIGPGTAAAIVKRGSDGTWDTVLHAGTSGSTTRWALRVSDTDLVTLSLGTTNLTAAGVGLLAADDWALIAARKASGTVAARVSVYKYPAATWAHGDTASVKNSGLPSGNNYLGGLGGTLLHHGDVKIIGVWDTVLTDAEIEALPFTRAAWNLASLRGLWRPADDPATAVLDETAFGADQTAITGTTASSSSPPEFTDEGADTTPPVTTLGSQTRTIISRVAGWDAFDVTISTDEAIVEYELRRVPAEASTRTEGTQIETGVVASTTSLVRTVTDDELVASLGVEGANTVKAFTKDAAGNWSP